MRRIEISDEVWLEIAQRGKFGETEDDVLARVFKIPRNDSEHREALGMSTRNSFATERMRTEVYREGNRHHHKILFHATGEHQILDLPADRSDKPAIRDALEKALQFGTAHGASKGQLMAIRKAFTEAGYHLTKVSRHSLVF
jgi:hypothetical protein